MQRLVYFAVLLAALPAAADTVNVSASDNAYVLRSSASSDQSETQTLGTKRLNDSNTRIAYVRFNLGAFLSSYPAANITSATLQLYLTAGAGDTVLVLGLQDAIAGTNGFDSAWTSAMTWNNQPSKTASPNDIPGSSTALPNANTSALLGSLAIAGTAGEIDIPLDLAGFQSWLAADSNQQITLLFYNTGANVLSWASLANTSGYLAPTLQLVATPSTGPVRSLTWDGAASSNWDTNSLNWKTNFAAPATLYNQGDYVSFTDARTGSSTVNLALALTPSSLTVSNVAVNYTFSGSGKISGITGLLKTGGGTLSLNTSNDFSGSVLVSGGTLKAGNPGALGAASARTFVTNGATLDINSQNLSTESVIASGAGVGGNGAIVNSGAVQTSALHNLTLAGDTTLGAASRWDIRAASTSSTNGCSLSTSGQPYKLTKLGASQLSLVGVSVDRALGDIVVQQGVFSVETATSSLGNPTNTLSVSSGATLQFYQLSGILAKNLVLAGGATLYNNSGITTFGGPVALLGNATLNVGGTSLVLTNSVKGSGGLTKLGTGTLLLNGPCAYSGPTVLSTGELVLGPQFNSAGPLTTTSGTTLSAQGTNAGLVTVSGILQPGDSGSLGTFTAGGLTFNAGATLSVDVTPSGNDQIQVNGNLTLNNNTVAVSPVGNLQTNLPYPLLRYTGTRSGAFNPVVNLDNSFAATLDYSTPGQINLIFSRVATSVIPIDYPTSPGPMGIALGPDGKLGYTPDANGDVIPDFSYAGYRGGGVPIPDNIPVVTTLSPISGDNRPQIQAAIDNLAARPLGTNGFRGVIYLNPGLYPISDSIIIATSGIVLRGAGYATNGTVLQLQAGVDAFEVNNPSGVGRTEVVGTRHNIANHYVPFGARWFTLDSTAGWSVGDNIVIHRPSTANWCAAINTSTKYPISWTGGEVDLNWERTVVAIEGNRVLIDAPLMQSLDQQYGGGYAYKFSYAGRTENVGVEGFRAYCTAGVDTNGNTSGQLFTVSGAMNCWFRNCMNDKMSGHTVKVSGGKYCTFQDIVSYHIPLPGGHSGASIQINTHDGSQGLLFHRFVTSDAGFEFSSGGTSPGPNVVSECDIPHGFAATGPHMKWTVGTIYDACFFHHGISSLNAGGSHGWQGANHVDWNTESHGIEFDRPPTAHQLIIGAISTAATPTPVRQGCLEPEVTSWQQHVDPRSLYRAQLAERVGPQQVLAVLGPPFGDNYYALTPATNCQATQPGQAASVPVAMTVMADYPGANIITNVFGSVVLDAWPGSNVTFSVSGLPYGASATFSSRALNRPGTNYLNIVASNTCPAGTYPLLIKGSAVFPNIRGSSSPLNQYAPVTLSVAGANNFCLSASPFSQTVVPGTNVLFPVQVTGSNGFSGAVALSVTNLPPGVGASFSSPSVSGSGSSTLTLSVSNTAPGGSYTLTLMGSSGGQASGATINLTVLSTALPSPWVEQDIGSPSQTGDATWLSGGFTIQGGGHDIWGSSDQFHYVYQSLAGDFAITARIASEQNTDPWAKVGIMMRESTNANSPYVALYVTPTSSHGVALQYRLSTGATAADMADLAGPVAPYWVRLVRSGNKFTGYCSSDGYTWSQVGIVSASMAANLTAGLAVCAHSSSALNTSTFDNVSLDYPDFTVQGSPDEQTVTGGDSTSFTVTVSPVFGFSGPVTLTVDGLPAGCTGTFEPSTILGSGSSTLNISISNRTLPDSYDLTLRGLSHSLESEDTVTLTVNAADADGDGIPDWWMLRYFGHPGGQASDLSRLTDDADSDGLSNWAEYLCGTDPTSSRSCLRVVSVVPQGQDELLTWTTVGGTSYVVQAASDLDATNAFRDLSPVIQAPGSGESTASFLDVDAATNAGPRFYRVRLEP